MSTRIARAPHPTCYRFSPHSLEPVSQESHPNPPALLKSILSFMLAALFLIAPHLSFAQKPPAIFNDGVLEAFVPGPLSNIAVLEPSNLMDFVADRDAAIRLGKALFWDMSVGSDGIQACASCHYHAGADPRSMNQLNPERKVGGTVFHLPGANYQLDPSDFPFVNFLDPSNRFSAQTSDIHDVVSSQGVARTDFVGINPDPTNPVDNVTVIPDPVFNAPNSAGGPNVNTRRVEPRNTPTVINAVHNLRNFHDGRAAASFNGVSPLGIHDPGARIFVVDPADPTKTTVDPQTISLAVSSLASQAVGPPLSFFEMSALGRTFPDVGRKLLPMQPLMQQEVDPTDSVLGPLAGLSPTAPVGLPGTYADMVMAAFLPKYWDSPTTVLGGFTVMEANFSLFFGLAVQMYEATLVSDDRKFDQVRRGETTLTAQEKRGLEIFTNIGQNTNPDIPVTFCAACHLGTEFTGAAIGQIGLAPLVVPGAFAEAAEFLVERMPSGAGLALGTLVYSTSPLPDQLPFPAGFEDPINSPLHKGKIKVSPTPGDPTAQGTFKIEVGDKLTKQGVHTLFLEPKAERPDDPELTLVLTVAADGSITFELSHLNLPDGSYDVTVNGLFFGNIAAIPNRLYDLGFYNIGVTPSGDDLSLGAVPGPNPDLHPLGFSAQRILGIPEAHILEGVPSVLDPATGLPLTLPPSKPADLLTGALVDGAFKVPGLSNVELTAPYFHNGGKRTLCEVVEFYNRGGDFHGVNLLDLDPTIQALGMTEQDIADVVAFLLTLTDERVRHKSAPFDHPELRVPNGHVGDHTGVSSTAMAGVADDNMLIIPAVGAAGGPPITGNGFLGGEVTPCLAAGPPPPDTTAPVITAPADVTVVSNTDIFVNIGTATATDNVSDPANILITHNAPAGFIFPAGTTTVVTWTAKDEAGNTATAQQNVTVNLAPDVTAPVLTVPADVTTEATGPNTPVAIGMATATDDTDPNPAITNDAPVTFPVGTTVVNWTATDASANSVSAPQNVTVTDTTAPTVIAPPDVTSVGQPADIGTATATDLVDPNPAITNDAPAPFPLGLTVVTWTATDASANSSTAMQNVIVTEPPPPGASIHVADLDGSTISLQEGKWKAVVAISISDNGGAPVDGAAVSATWTWFKEGEKKQKTGACTTAGGGMCSITSKTFETATAATLTVDNVSSPPLVYDAASNTDPDGESDGTTIAINKP